MLAALPEDRYETRDIFIDKKGFWYLRGFPAEASRILAQVDVVLNGLHGGVGEDGTVQRILERHGARYVGSGALASSISNNKARTYEVARAAGIRMPRYASFTVHNPMTTADMARAVFSGFGPPYILKPPLEGASRGISLVANIAELSDALGDALDEFGAVIVQEFIRGENARVGLIENFRGQELYALPPAHMPMPQGKRFIDAAARQEGLLRHIVPSNFSREEKSSLEEAAKAVHRALGLSHYSRIDFILWGGKPYLLEATGLPGLYEGAAFPQMLEAVGSSVPELLEHAIALARN